MNRAIIIFTRVPIPGQTKTRMMPDLSGRDCSRLHTCFIRDIYEECRKTKADIFVCYTPEEQKYLLEDVISYPFQGFSQGGENLGKRMYHGLQTVFDKGYESCILIGTDIPGISRNILEEGFEHLETDDVVLHPTVDGGYYLIGMKQPYEHIWDIPRYGTNTVIKDTVDQIEAVGLSVGLGTQLRDIDTIEDLRALIMNEEPMGRHTMAYIGKELIKNGPF